MSSLDLKKEDFIKWLSNQSSDAEVGITISKSCCPISKFVALDCPVGTKVAVETDKIYVTHGPLELWGEANLPDWAILFISRIDSLYGGYPGPVTAKDAMWALR